LRERFAFMRLRVAPSGLRKRTGLAPRKPRARVARRAACRLEPRPARTRGAPVVTHAQSESASRRSG
jgi:hypothetical protein